ncbi:MAG: hypothetical protein FWG68_10090, partial [Defluviitaleaceae bacterium]|nr:hypothetical protein [Defluviitaleaceae bacterium]
MDMWRNLWISFEGGMRKKRADNIRPYLRTFLLNHWGLDGRATEDGRPYLSADRQAGTHIVGATVL